MLARADYELSGGAPDVLGLKGRRRGAPLEFPAELFPPADSRALVLTDQQVIAGAGVSAKPAGLSMQLPLGVVGIIRAIQIFVDAPDLSTRATWRVKVNGANVQGLENLTMIFRAAASIARDFDTMRVELPDNALVEVEITNVDGAPHVYGAQLVGWLWQIEADYVR